MKKYIFTIALLFAIFFSAFSQIKVTKSGGLIIAEEDGKDTQTFNPGSNDLSISGNQLILIDKITYTNFLLGDYTNILKADSTAPTSLNDAIDYLSYLLSAVPLESNGAVPVNIQDQTTPVLISQLNKKTGETTLSSTTSIGDTQITVTSATGIELDDLIVITTAEGRTFVGKITDITGAPVLIIDTPINFVFSAGTYVGFGKTELNVLGSRLSPQIFSARGVGGDIPIIIDITRIIFTMVTATPVDLLKFGDLAILTNGIVLRRTDGTISNIVNIKSNAAFANIAYDFTVYAATNPQQGVDGLVCRLTFAGQNKMGVAIRLAPDEDLELLIQDDLTGITEFSAVVEGHVVTD